MEINCALCTYQWNTGLVMIPQSLITDQPQSIELGVAEGGFATGENILVRSW